MVTQLVNGKAGLHTQVYSTLETTPHTPPRPLPHKIPPLSHTTVAVMTAD